MSGQQVLTKQTLRQLPFLWEHPGLFHHGMDPGNSVWYIWVFYSVPILRVIEHDFTGSAPALSINLEEDGALGFGDANLVLIDEAFDDEWVKEGAQESDKIRVSVETDGTGD